MKKLFVLTCVFLLVNYFARSQSYGDISIEGGLSVLSVIGDNQTTSTFAREFGASYNGSQLGVGAKMHVTMNDRGTVHIPIGFDFNRLYSSERYYQSELIRITNTNENNMFSFTTGAQYSFLRFPALGARIYTGIEGKFSFIDQGMFTLDFDYTESEDFDQFNEINTKESRFRIGGFLRVGLESRIDDRYYVNFSMAAGALNFLMRDDITGELFTPFKEEGPYNETEEPVVYVFQISMNIQYKL